MGLNFVSSRLYKTHFGYNRDLVILIFLQEQVWLHMYLFNGCKNIQNLSQLVVVIFFSKKINRFYFSFQILNISVNICDYSLSLHVPLVSFPSFITYFKFVYIFTILQETRFWFCFSSLLGFLFYLCCFRPCFLACCCYFPTSFFSFFNFNCILVSGVQHND